MTNLIPTIGVGSFGLLTFQPLPDVEPFSIRSAASYEEILSTIRVWIRDTLIPYLSTDGIQATFQSNITTMIDTVNAALAQAVHDVSTGSIPVTDAAVAAVLAEVTSATKSALDGLYDPKRTAFGFYVLTGTGIDLTGATDSTAAVNTFLAALPDGSSVRTASGAVYMLSDTIELPHRVHLHGDGELRWVSGIASKPMIHVTADGTNLDGLYCTNPNHLAAQAPATRTYGVYIEANTVRVSECRIVGQQQAICVGAGGEFHDTIIVNNIVLDVPGSGSGPGVNDSVGEDRGDGIIVWGATAIITGNRVALLNGSDGRVGIHTESLPGSEAVGYVHGDAHTIIANNIVTGKFRRGITDEGVAFCVITDNTVADATWWGINIVNTAHDTVVANNTIEWTRTTADTQGSSWSPQRAGIMVYDQVQYAQVRGNIIAVATGAAMPNGIVVQASVNDTAHRSVGIDIEGNRISDPNWAMNTGINIVNGSTGTRVRNNDITGFIMNGVFASHADEFSASGNRITGNSANITAKGIICQDGATSAKITDNTISYVTTALALFAITLFIHSVGNVIRQATTGQDFFGSSGAVTTINSNTNINVTTKLTNLPTTNVQIGNN